MQFPLLIELRRSRRLGFLLLAFHVAAMLSALVSLLPRDDLPYRFSILALLLALIAVSAWSVLRRNQAGRLQLAADGALLLSFGDMWSEMRQAVVLPDSTVFRYLVVLRLRVEGETGIRNLVLLPDQMHAEQFRQLIVCLRWMVKTNTASDD